MVVSVGAAHVANLRRAFDRVQNFLLRFVATNQLEEKVRLNAESVATRASRSERRRRGQRGSRTSLFYVTGDGSRHSDMSRGSPLRRCLVGWLRSRAGALKGRPYKDGRRPIS